MRRVLLAVALAGAAAADDAVVARWDKPRRESFDLKAVSAPQAAEEIAKRYGIAVKAGAAGAAADFAANDVTFLEALDRLAAVHGLVLLGAPVDGARGMWGEPHALALARPAEGVRAIPAVHFGGSRLSVQGVFVVSAAALAPEPEDTMPFMRLGLGGHRVPGLGLRLRWIAEPEFEGTALLEFEVVAAEDDAGQPIEVAENAFLEGLHTPMPANRDFIVRLGPPSPKAKAIRKLEGRLRVAIPLERQRIEFGADEVGKTKSLGKAEVTLDGIDGEAKAVTLTVRGAPCAEVGERSFPDLVVGSDDRAWHGSWKGSALRIVPFDQAGREIAQGDHGTETEGDDASWTAKVALEAVPARLAVEALVRAAVREATFSFKDIPLPE